MEINHVGGYNLYRFEDEDTLQGDEWSVHVVISAW